MQGFNRYIPPDYDPKKVSTLNAYQGKKHALGVRAKDIDKGILVVRFELPFNIWCGSCDAHIGAGVRYNAQKRKVGKYYSTPIYAFRCKCHLCSGWFEIRTDPQNAAYVVEEGAKRKEEDWNPEENGGFKVFDTEAPSASEPPADPIAQLEKTITQEAFAKKGSSRITELSHASARLSADPYAVSVALRNKFREEKKIMLEKQGRDDSLRERYGLSGDVDLGEEDVQGGKDQWRSSRADKGLSLSGESNGSKSSIRGVERLVGRNSKGKGRASDVSDLAAALRRTTARKYDPFDLPTPGFASGISSPLTSDAKAPSEKFSGNKMMKTLHIKPRRSMEAPTKAAGRGLLLGYDSE